MKSNKVIFKNVLNACVNLAVLDEASRFIPALSKQHWKALCLLRMPLLTCTQSPKVCKLCIKHLKTFLCVI